VRSDPAATKVTTALLLQGYATRQLAVDIIEMKTSNRVVKGVLTQ
jgi:hypothetical protein